MKIIRVILSLILMKTVEPLVCSLNTTYIDLKLFERQEFGIELTTSIETVKMSMLAQKMITGIVGVVPVIGAIASKAIETVSSPILDHFYTKSYLTGISIEIDHSIAVNWVSVIKATMLAIRSEFYTLHRADPLSEATIKSIVNIINHEIMTLLNIFADKDSIFRRYPLVAIIPLYKITELIILFDPILSAVEPNIATHSLHRYKLIDVLSSYRILAIIFRMKKFDNCLLVKGGVDLHKLGAGYVMSKQNSRNGYSESCQTLCTLNTDMVCLKGSKDLITNAFYSDIDADEMDSDNCMKTVMSKVRFQIEQIFDGMIDSLTTTSTSNAQNLRKRTGSNEIF